MNINTISAAHAVPPALRTAVGPHKATTRPRSIRRSGRVTGYSSITNPYRGIKIRNGRVGDHPGSRRFVQLCGVERGLGGRSVQLVNGSIKGNLNDNRRGA